MTTVFLSGSRKISQLDEAVTSRLSTIVEKGFRVIVGDANGADKAFQADLAGMDYVDVTIEVQLLTLSCVLLYRSDPVGQSQTTKLPQATVRLKT